MRLLAPFFLMFLAACTGDPKSTLCQLSALTYTSGGTTSGENYFYTDGRLTKTTTTSGREIVYKYGVTGDLSKATTTDNGITYVTTYGYDSTHFLITSLYGNSGDTVRTIYYYNDIGQFIREDRTITNSSGTRLAKLYYTYPDLITHNPATIALVDLGDSIVNHYEYDNKINPDREFLPTIKAYNNITRMTTPTFSTTITYQYNSNGYPVSSAASNGTTQTWTYSCQEF